MSVLKVNQIQTANGVIMANLNSSGANAGIQLASNLAPAFSAFNTGSQSLTSATATKVILQNENFDTANCFDSTTNYRFTPNVAGYYQLNGIIYVSSSSTAYSVIAMIYKNGSVYQSGSFQSTSAPGNNGGGQVSAVVYLNGTTDYIELYGYAAIFGSGTLADAGTLGLKCHLSGAMMRSA